MAGNSLAVFTVLIILLTGQFTFASSCCGQSGGSFPVSYLKQKLSLNMALSRSESLGRVRAGSNQFVTFSDDKKLLKESLGFDAVYSLTDRSQMFTKASFFRNSYSSAVLNQQQTDLSDLVIGYTYEVLPEYTYSKWKPVVYLSTLLNLPTGRSVHDPNGLAEGADVTGYDQWGLGAGLTFRKVWFPFRAIVQLKSLALFRDDLSGVEVSNFWEHSAGLTLSYSVPNFYDVNLTSGLTWQSLQGRSVDKIRTADSEFVSFNFSIIKPLNDSFVLSVNYVDQTLLGTPENSLLNRAFSTNINYNFY
jgi:hypothetical protein